MNHLEEAILKIIEQKYQCKYISGIKVTKIENGFKLALDLGVPEKPLTISADIEDENKFLKFIEKELISRQLYKADRFRGIKKELEDDLRGTCLQNR